MSASLLIRIDETGALSWRQDAAGARGAGAPPPPVLAGAGRVTVLVPGEDVLVTRVALPPGSAARLAQLAPWALEDQLLDDVENLHVAVASAATGEGHAVAVASRARMREWTGILAHAGIEADAMLPDFLAVPLDPERATALRIGERCLVRTGVAEGFVCAGDEIAQWLPAAAELRLIVPAGASAPSRDGWQVERAAAPESLLVAAADPGVPDLLQGEFAPRRRRGSQRRLWRLAAVLLAAALLVGLAGKLVSITRLQTASHSAEASLQERFAELFPGVPAGPDPVAFARSELQRLGGGEATADGLLAVLAAAGPILASHDIKLEMRGMEYRNGSLELSVHAPSLANLDQLRERLATLPGLRVQLSAATPGPDGIEGRIRIAEAGS